MNTVNTVAIWINQLFGMESFKGRCVFLYDERIELSIEASEDDRTIFIYAPVAQVPTAGKESFYEEMLSLSHPGGELRGACLSLDQDKQNVVLWYTRPFESLDIEGFQNMVGSFLDMADNVWSSFESGQTQGSRSDQPGERYSTAGRRGMDVFRP